MQLPGLAKIQLAEDLSSVRVLEWVPVTWKYTKFTQFWSSPRILQLFGQINSCLENFVFFTEKGHYLVKSVGLAAIRMNKFLSGEFCVFRGKNGHYWLWALPWKFGSRIKFDRTKFILFMVKVTDWVVS